MGEILSSFQVRGQQPRLVTSANVKNTTAPPDVSTRLPNMESGRLPYCLRTYSAKGVNSIHKEFTSKHLSIEPGDPASIDWQNTVRGYHFSKHEIVTRTFMPALQSTNTANASTEAMSLRTSILSSCVKGRLLARRIAGVLLHQSTLSYLCVHH